jgi:hypothetical protein
MAWTGLARGWGVGGISHYFFFASLLFCHSIVGAFHLLQSSRGLRSTRRLMVDPIKVLTAAPTASHSIVSGPKGLFCCKCGETKNFKTTCAPAAAECAAAQALELVKINVQIDSVHALELVKINATATENEAQRASAHALELVRIRAAAKENFARNATSVLIGCLALTVMSFFSREVAWWVKASVVPLLNSAREKLLVLIGGVVGFATGAYVRR